MSLDGFITERGVSNPLGDDPGRLHDRMFDAKTETDAAVLDQIYASSGAILIRKRMFDVGFEPWGDPPPFAMLVVVVTHEEREPLPMQGGTTYTFVTDGIESVGRSVGCSQNALTPVNSATWLERPQVKEATTHSRSEGFRGV